MRLTGSKEMRERLDELEKRLTQAVVVTSLMKSRLELLERRVTDMTGDSR